METTSELYEYSAHLTASQSFFKNIRQLDNLLTFNIPVNLL